MKKRVKCLYRVSSKKQVEKEDIPMQRQACHEFAARFPDWEIVDEKLELGISAYKVQPLKRDVIVELRREAMDKEFDILLVFMSDRLCRIADESPLCASWFATQGVEVWSVQEGQLHFDTPIDKLMNYIRFMQAEEESHKTSIRTKTRLGQIVQEGRFRGGKAPYGYRLEKHGRCNARGHEVNEILVDEAEAAVVSDIFRLSAECGYGSRRIASVLKEQGILNREGKPFHPATIQNMLKNVLYTGILRSGESFSEPFEHLQIIPPTIFEIVQRQIAEHRSGYEESRLSPLRREGQALLSGNIFCGTCGGRLISTTVRKIHHPTAGENPRIPTYRCYNRIQHKEECSGQSVYRAEKVDEIVDDAVRHVLAHIKRMETKNYIQRRRQQELNSARCQARQMEKRYADAAEERRRLARHMGAALDGEGPFTAEELKEQMDALKAECDQLSAQMEAQKNLLTQTERKEAFIAHQFETLKSYADVYDRATFEEKRRIVSALIEKVTVTRGYHIHIDFRIGLDLLEEMDLAG